ncbi:beta family protein [Streptomyces griseocarneus]|uniref:beta family protein n=1 Tax=Streptomyces griseocarneus TaxID=51201 RepID=UPI00167CCE1E|nr:beta family protein [Streptomyces griseocarneus]MBZ6472476.1 beta family protein [Streptomyces griseocarneus]
MAYVPILKGKAGEFLALEHTTPEVRSGIRPVMEIVPDLSLRDLLETFCKHAMERVPKGMVLTVDCGALPVERVLEGDSGGPMMRLGESLGQRGVLMCPVVRATDSDDVLSEVAYVAEQHRQGVCLRVSVASGSDKPDPDERLIRRLLCALQAEPEEVDLLIDAGSVQSDADTDVLAGRVIERSHDLLRWPWRHQCVASGAFPFNLTGFPRGQTTAVARKDAQLWKRVVGRWDGERPDFGDFGVTHPRMPVQSRGTPDPNMRYTTTDNWQVFVYPRIRSGNDDFFTLSHDLVSSPYWPPTGPHTSWGDARIHECAHRQRPKAGGGREWRAWATSHHLAVVTSNLSSHGHP